MKKCFIRHILCSLLIFTAISCQDEFMKEEFIGEGMATVSATVDFKPMSSALARTKAAGDALKDITSLHVLLYNNNKELIKKWMINSYKETDVERGATDAENAHLAETTTKRATFKLPEAIESGTYYMYAVANIPDLLTAHSKEIETVDGLKGISLTWNSENISANGQMIGCFTSASTDTPTTTDSPLVLSGDTKPHAWLRRAASKVTVAFDASGLRDSVSIYLKAVRIKNIPMYCKLGEDNKVIKEGEEGAPLIENGEEVKYSESSSYDENYPALITKHQPYYPMGTKIEEKDTILWTPNPDRHSETHPNSLFFYENMQEKGPDKSAYADSNGDGILDGTYKHKEKPYATYIEVDAFYESIHPDRPGMSNITYRFMLGQDVTTDYNAKRNCHYKLTLHFNGFADEPDWRIDYVTRFGATHPEPVDYRGKYFVPDNVSSNQGNYFSDNNIITVASYQYEADAWTQRTPLNYKIEYKDAGSQNFTETLPTWLDDFIKTDKGNGVHELKIKYKNPYTSVSINDELSTRPVKSGTYDLSTKGGTTSMNTANCYIVDSKGTYQFPLVYGNAIEDGGTNETSYIYQKWGTGDNYLKTFKNYKDQGIQSPYILDDIYTKNNLDVPTNLTASLVWQDEQDLVTNITYIPGTPGAIKFEVNNPKEGNAVIALKDPSGTIMWSWHIWVTAMDLTRTLTLTNNEKHGSRQFEILPVNLGWCSGNIPVRYYDRHECEVRFTQILNDGNEGMSKTVKIVQEPHIALPCGNNPYYQHGRKDPFVASGGANQTNKQWYDASGASSTSAPQTIKNNTPEPVYEAQRLETYKATALLIQNPDKWQNCPHEENTNPKIAGKYVPKDNIFFNLWDNSCWDDNDDIVKTVYDPCPVGYHVSSIYTFSGFTDHGENVSNANLENAYSTNTYGVIEDNMLTKPEYRNNIVEFYTNKTKLISIGFLANGYRDWDDGAKVWQFGQGEVWCAQGALWSSMVIGNTTYYPNAYHLEFTRLTTGFTPHIFPWNNYYATDGMAVRPTRTLP